MSCKATNDLTGTLFSRINDAVPFRTDRYEKNLLTRDPTE